MKITFLDWSCFGRENCISAFKQLGHDVTLFFIRNMICASLLPLMLLSMYN